MYISPPQKKLNSPVIFFYTLFIYLHIQIFTWTVFNWNRFHEFSNMMLSFIFKYTFFVDFFFFFTWPFSFQTFLHLFWGVKNPTWCSHDLKRTFMCFSYVITFYSYATKQNKKNSNDLKWRNEEKKERREEIFLTERESALFSWIIWSLTYFTLSSWSAEFFFPLSSSTCRTSATAPGEKLRATNFTTNMRFKISCMPHTVPRTRREADTGVRRSWRLQMKSGQDYNMTSILMTRGASVGFTVK